MKKALITLVCIFACALSCAGVFWLKAGAEDGYTLQAFDSGPSPWWIVGCIVFLVVAVLLCHAWHKILEAGGGSHVVN